MLTGDKIIKMGFHCYFGTDPQQYPASKVYEADGVKIIQPSEAKEEFYIYPEHGSRVKIQSLRDIKIMMHGMKFDNQSKS